MNRITILLVVAALYISTSTNAQNNNHVTHTSGTIDHAGTDVTVTSSGCFDILTSYCPFITTPYIIGFNSWNSSYCDGEYTFAFSPPVNSLTLNFSGITKSQNHVEVITLYVNGSHYPIPAAGAPNACDAMAELDADGNVAACDGCIEAGWVGTTISGPISVLTVKDSVFSGSPGGSLFSLFISDVAADLSENSVSQLELFPNPFTNEFSVTATSTGIVTLIDIRGTKVLEQEMIVGSNAITTENLDAGAYVVHFVSDTGKEEFQKVIKQ